MWKNKIIRTDHHLCPALLFFVPLRSTFSCSTSELCPFMEIGLVLWGVIIMVKCLHGHCLLLFQRGDEREGKGNPPVIEMLHWNWSAWPRGIKERLCDASNKQIWFAEAFTSISCPLAFYFYFLLFFCLQLGSDSVNSPIRFVSFGLGQHLSSHPERNTVVGE